MPLMEIALLKFSKGIVNAPQHYSPTILFYKKKLVLLGLFPDWVAQDQHNQQARERLNPGMPMPNEKAGSSAGVIDHAHEKS